MLWKQSAWRWCQSCSSHSSAGHTKQARETSKSLNNNRQTKQIDFEKKNGYKVSAIGFFTKPEDFSAKIKNGEKILEARFFPVTVGESSCGDWVLMPETQTLDLRLEKNWSQWEELPVVNEG